ncbi:K+ channel protein [Catenaria anguillulae PL171]|uniref:K+ channel protein n=1 Tax=Catenaria anguillulae PL171 TaxID=765915 RepID=A0A1Y2HQJ8_9FUNG|nr:K+ channel protein [Catenaria anguillulae PL171]
MSSTTEVPAMEYRYLGRSGLKVSVLSLGGWVTYGGQVKDTDITYECIKQAWDLGINFFDNAEVYAAGQSEIDMGAALKRLPGVKRSDLVISTKVFWAGKGPNDHGLSRKHIVEGLQASLKRMGLEYVDVVFAHRPDPDTPMEEIVRAFNHVMDRGWTFYWGTSEWSAQQITEAHLVAQRLGLVGPLCEQPQYNCFHRERFEKEYDPLYKAFGLGTTIWSPLASGVLTGKYSGGPDKIPADSRLAIKDNAIMERLRNDLGTDEGKAKLAKVAKLTKVAEKLGATTAQLALAWCVKNQNVSTVITGASRPSQIVENVKSLAVGPKLTPEIMAEIDEILANKPKPEMNFRAL